MPRSHLVIGADGVVLVRRMIFLTSTTPAAAFIEASPYRARASRASAFPSSAEEGISALGAALFSKGESLTGIMRSVDPIQTGKRGRYVSSKCGSWVDYFTGPRVRATRWRSRQEDRHR